ncbi:MAG TPA: diacylglycerol kinase [Prolixibacteraceae bacterium]|jgi:undecaprenol kinase/diacylglycerol kinase (ATP)|nr:diacylglycerol kinase [Prolixibacteraceae bacterium]
MKQQGFSINKRFKSFAYAWNGIKILLREEHNSRIHLVAAIGVVMAGFFFKISALEWMGIVFAIGLVIVLEIINSAIENISDFISPGMNDQIKKIKDLSAAGVLVGAITAAIIGLIVFVPKIMKLW